MITPTLLRGDRLLHHLPAHRGRRRLLAAACAVAVGAVGGLIGGASAFADTVRDHQWYLQTLDVATNQAAAHGGAGVIVAVIDSGVDATQPDLAGNVLDGVDAFTGNVADAHVDPWGHGTSMAALIAGHGHGAGNTDGVLGIAPNAKILPIRLRYTGGGNFADGDYVARAFDFAVAHGATVISCSFGVGPGRLLQQAIDRALDKGVIVIAATANIEKSAGNVMDAPAMFPGVISVGAVDRSGNHAAFSLPADANTQLSLSAPGVDIPNANPGNRYELSRDGTSISTAIVSGAAALIRAKYPTMPGYEVAHRLMATATDKGDPGYDNLYGNGVLNLTAALNANVPPTPAPSPHTSGATQASPSPSATATPQAATHHGTSALLVTAIVIGALLVLAAIAGLITCLTLRRRSGR